MNQLGYPLLVVGCLPLFVSVVTRTWSRAWREEQNSVLSANHDRALTLLELVVATGAVLVPLRWTVGGVAALYAALAVGAFIFWRRLGSVSCGCWGSASQSRLGWRLVAANALCALAIAVLLIAWQTPDAWGPHRLAVWAMTAIAALFLGVILPTAKAALRSATQHADQFRAWARGFPQLKVH